MSRNALVSIFAVVVFLILGQYKVFRPYVMGLGVILFIGYLLVHYPTIRAQFQAIGGTSGGGSSGGSIAPKYSAN